MPSVIERPHTRRRTGTSGKVTLRPGYPLKPATDFTRLSRTRRCDHRANPGLAIETLRPPGQDTFRGASDRPLLDPEVRAVAAECGRG